MCNDSENMWIVDSKWGLLSIKCQIPVHVEYILTFIVNVKSQFDSYGTSLSVTLSGTIWQYKFCGSKICGHKLHNS